MVHHRWISENRKITVCVDTYDSGILRGRFYSLCREMEPFCGLPDLLIRIDELLDEQREPQSYTEPRRFTPPLSTAFRPDSVEGIRKGAVATFEVQILFRQHSSWQGILRWREENAEQSFRSVLELIFLMDSALQGSEGGECA